MAGTAAKSGLVLLDQHGQPLERPRAKSMASAFTASDRLGPELMRWVPFLGSADSDLLPERDTIAARIHDLARNDGWTSGALQKHLDNVIGAGLRLSAKPDYRALGLDAQWAREWTRDVEAKWRGFADNPGRYCDAARRNTISGLFGLLYRHKVLDGESLALLLYDEKRPGYATHVQVIDPDRLSNPNDAPDRDDLRGGVEITRRGEPLAYHIRERHPGEFLAGGFLRSSYRWERVVRETPWGRPMVIHHFEAQRAGQTRGIPPLTAVVKKLRMLGRYDETELQAAIINAIFAAFIESPFDHDMLAEGLDVGTYQGGRGEYWKEQGRIALNGVQIPMLYPGEKFTPLSATRPNTAFGPFQQVALRNIATALGLSYEQLSMDWSQTNYSSARAALLEVWKYMTARRRAFEQDGPDLIYCAWLEEAIDIGEVEIPPGAPEFYEAKAAYTRCRWIGPGRGWVDPVKEKQAAVLGMEALLSTLEQECAEQGLDYEEVIEQRVVELQMLREKGLPAPSWANAIAFPTPPPGEPEQRPTQPREE